MVAFKELQHDLENKATDLNKLQKAKNHQIQKRCTIQLGENELVLKVANQETYGTLCAIVRSQLGNHQFGFLTNWHVAVDLDYPNQKMFHDFPPDTWTWGLSWCSRKSNFVH